MVSSEIATGVTLPARALSNRHAASSGSTMITRGASAPQYWRSAAATDAASPPTPPCRNTWVGAVSSASQISRVITA